MTVNPDKKPVTPPLASASGPPAGQTTATSTGPATSAAANDGGTTNTDEADEADNRSKLFIVVGQVHEFATAAQAEKFLNQAGAPTKFTVLRGREVKSKQRVSLRG